MEINSWSENISKEFRRNQNFHCYDYGARMYDPTLGVFSTIDPKAEKYNYQSLYAYAVNNPVRYPDINGEGIPPLESPYLERTRMVINGATEKELADFDGGVNKGYKFAATGGVTIVASTALLLTSEVWMPFLAAAGMEVSSIAEATPWVIAEFSLRFPKLYAIAVSAVLAEAAPPGTIIPGTSTEFKFSDLTWAAFKTFFKIQGDTREMEKKELERLQKKQKEKRERQEKRERRRREKKMKELQNYLDEISKKDKM